MRLLWFLSTGQTERGPIHMEDVDLENRIFRDHRMPVHQRRTEAEKESTARVTWQAGQQ